MRAKSGVARHARKKKIMKIVKGFRGAPGNRLRLAIQTSIRALRYSTVGRKVKKRDMRSMWITRINGALVGKGINYNSFMNALKRANIVLNRKMLSELAIQDPKAFDAIVEESKKVLAASKN